MLCTRLSGTVGKLRSWDYRAVATKRRHSFLQQIVLSIFLCSLSWEDSWEQDSMLFWSLYIKRVRIKSNVYQVLILCLAFHKSILAIISYHNPNCIYLSASHSPASVLCLRLFHLPVKKIFFRFGQILPNQELTWGVRSHDYVGWKLPKIF